MVKDFIDYRKKIKSYIKTTAPIKAYMKALRELVAKGYDLNEVIDLQREKEWQTIKADWVEKMIKPKIQEGKSIIDKIKLTSGTDMSIFERYNKGN